MDRGGEDYQASSLKTISLEEHTVTLLVKIC